MSPPCQGEHLESNARFRQVVHRVDQVPQVAAQAVELPDDQRVPVAQRLQASGETGPVVTLA